MTQAGFETYEPTVVVRPLEQKIYEEMWTKPQYRIVSPGENIAQTFLEQAKPKRGATVMDLGCGTGRGGLMLAVLGGMNVTFVDFAKNSLDEDIVPMLETQKEVMRFVEADLTKKLPTQTEYGFCCDVLEHIPESQVNAVLNNTLQACQHVFFQISTEPDVMGGLIGHPLHLTVKPYEWWLERFKERECVVHYSKNLGDACIFYVSAWMDCKAWPAIGELNLAEEKCVENVKFNIHCGWKQVFPHEVSSVEVAILGGGPSLDVFEDDIRQKQKDGVKIVTLNGAYNWAAERGIGPVNQIIVDAREFNNRFVKPIDEKNLYLIASQCDPTVFVGLPKDRTLVWHTSTEMVKDVLNEYYTEEPWYGIMGGSTVLLRAIPLLRLLGLKKFHLYGCDSCIMEDKHHAYVQKENDNQLVIPVNCGGRIFQCNAWQASQAQEFMDLIRVLGNEIELEIYGDGLLSHILQTGASLNNEIELA